MKKRILSAVLAAVMIIGVWTLASCGKKNEEPTFEKPEEHFDYVIDKNAGKVRSAIDASDVGKTLKGTESTVTMTGALTIHKGLTDLLTLVLSQSGQSVDLSFLRSVAFNMTVKNKGALIEDQIAVKLSDVDLISAMTQLNRDKQTVVFNVDPLFPKDYSADLSSLGGTALPDTSVRVDPAAAAKIGALMDGFMSEGGLFDRIKDLAPQFFTEITKGTETVSVGEIAEELTVFGARITPDTIIAAAKKADGIISENEKVKAVFDMIDPSFAGAAQEAEAHKDELPTVDVKAFVNEKNELRGVSFSISHKEKSYGSYKATYVEGEGQYAFLLSAEGVKEHSISVSSTGVRAESKLTGDFEVSYDGKKLCTFSLTDFDKDALKNGKFLGKISMRLSDLFAVIEQFADMSKLSSVRPFLVMLGELYFEGKDDGEMKVGMTSPKNKDGSADDLIALSFKATTETKADITERSGEPLPAATGVEGLSELMAPGLQVLLERLGKAGVPMEIFASLLTPRDQG